MSLRPHGPRTVIHQVQSAGQRLPPMAARALLQALTQALPVSDQSAAGQCLAGPPARDASDLVSAWPARRPAGWRRRRRCKA